MKAANQKNEHRAEKIRADARHDEIARRAYELWEQSGCPAGSAEADWLAAERQLLGRASLIDLPHGADRGR